jgi:hypothetical protein
MQDLQHEELTIRVEKKGDRICLRWAGKSTGRNPANVLFPFFESIVKEVDGQDIQVDNDLTKLQHLNSSTLAAMIGVMRIFRASGVTMRVLYDPMVGWQERSIDALRVLESPTSSVRFEKSHHGS